MPTFCQLYSLGEARLWVKHPPERMDLPNRSVSFGPAAAGPGEMGGTGYQPVLGGNLPPSLARQLDSAKNAMARPCGASVSNGEQEEAQSLGRVAHPVVGGRKLSLVIRTP